MNVLHFVAFHQQPYCVVVKYNQTHATGPEICQRKFGCVTATYFQKTSTAWNVLVRADF